MFGSLCVHQLMSVNLCDPVVQGQDIMGCHHVRLNQMNTDQTFRLSLNPTHHVVLVCWEVFTVVTVTDMSLNHGLDPTEDGPVH